jgi:Leucine-rich repeat (LRR) protein
MTAEQTINKGTMGIKDYHFKDLQEATILQPLASKYGAASILLETDSQGFVTGLTLQGLDLESIPEGIWQLSHLKKLDLRCNQITALPAKIALLKHLQSLDVSFNQLTSLPAEIAQLTNLLTLALQNTQLKAFPIEITALKNATSP